MKTQIYEIGQFYQVPCVQVVENLHWAQIGDWVPVLLPKHEDSEIIQFPYEHYHIDLRFLSQRAFDRITHFSVVLHDADSNLPHRGNTPYVDRVYLRRRKCRRRNPDYPHGRAFWMAELRKKYENATLKCGKCPHRGIDLSSQQVMAGCIVCPGHGLIWDVKTGKQVTPEDYELRRVMEG